MALHTGYTYPLTERNRIWLETSDRDIYTDFQFQTSDRDIVVPVFYAFNNSFISIFDNIDVIYTKFPQFLLTKIWHVCVKKRNTRHCELYKPIILHWFINQPAWQIS